MPPNQNSYYFLNIVRLFLNSTYGPMVIKLMKFKNLTFWASRLIKTSLGPLIFEKSLLKFRELGVLRKLKRIFPQHILRLIYNSLIHPHLIYGLNLWGFKHKRITILQKKAIRILAFRPYISHSTSAFKELKIPMLKNLYTIQLNKIYYKNIHNILPVYSKDFTGYNLVMLDKHCTTMLLNVNYIL